MLYKALHSNYNWSLCPSSGPKQIPSHHLWLLPICSPRGNPPCCAISSVSQISWIHPLFSILTGTTIPNILFYFSWQPASSFFDVCLKAWICDLAQTRADHGGRYLSPLWSKHSAISTQQDFQCCLMRYEQLAAIVQLLVNNDDKPALISPAQICWHHTSSR